MNTKKLFRKTKLIATIGPSCDNINTLKEMIRSGMNVARLNMSHGTIKSHSETLNKVRTAARELGMNIAVMVDNRGREIRTKDVLNGAVTLNHNDSFTLYTDDFAGDYSGVAITHPNLGNHVNPGDRILLDDGQIELIVKDIKPSSIICITECGGILRNNKGVNLPDNTSAFDEIQHNYADEVEFAIKHDVEYFAASFVRNAEEVRVLKNRFAELGGSIPIIAKIENKEGVKNIDEIIKTASGIMVARGDLGVELPLAQGPTIQKKIIRKTVTNGKPVITATQMLDSMERNPRPTRAEVSDVANAIFDGTSAVMLSGETAVGSRPVDAIKTMVSLAHEAESALDEYGTLQKILPNPSNEVTEAVAQASITMANHLNAAVIIALTETGFTSRLISKYRPNCPILAVTSSQMVVRRLAMNWGVNSIYNNLEGSNAHKVKMAVEHAKALGFAQQNDVIVVTAGSSNQAGGTDHIQVVKVQ